MIWAVFIFSGFAIGSGIYLLTRQIKKDAKKPFKMGEIKRDYEYFNNN